ncbi:MAG: hypothetical protein RI554_10940, partial [Trueperaceae bacterium]|nr:hypothetical protein [Trueperaceae bacterium]
DAPYDAPDDALAPPPPSPTPDLPPADAVAGAATHPPTPTPPAPDPWFDGGWTAPAPRPAWHGAGRRDDADPLDAPDDEARLAGIADDLLAEGQLSGDGTMLADVLADSDHGSRRARLRALIAAGATEDTIYVAWAVRETWNATHPYATGLSLGWNAAHRIADAFHGYPSADEVLAVLEPLEHAYRHARRRFGSYPGPFEAFLSEVLDADFGNVPAGDDLALRLGLRVASE